MNARTHSQTRGFLVPSTPRKVHGPTPTSLFPRSPLCLAILIIATLLAFAIFQKESVPSLQSVGSNNIDPPPISRLPTRPHWTFSNTPNFCKTIVASPVPLSRKCVRNVDTQTCDDGKVTMMSQFGQDYYLYTQHFSRLKRRGIYVDIATNDPTQISNTYFMDACMGWDGICVEANPEYFDGINKYRSCRLIGTCASDTDGENVTFIMSRAYGGMTDTNKNIDTDLKTRKKSEMKLTCTTMARALRESHVSYIDYLSLDVEGHELKVLYGFDWERVKVNVMTVEGTDSKIEKISELLLSKGYVRHIPTLNERSISTGRLGQDVVFLHESVTFGDPR